MEATQGTVAVAVLTLPARLPPACLPPAAPAGEDAQRIQPTLIKMKASGVRAILDYAAVESHSRHSPARWPCTVQGPPGGLQGWAAWGAELDKLAGVVQARGAACC